MQLHIVLVMKIEKEDVKNLEFFHMIALSWCCYHHAEKGILERQYHSIHFLCQPFL